MNEEKFSGKAENYDRFRPSYPRGLVDWLYELTSADAVADIGAGTGKFTQILLEKPWRVTAVEPNADMLARLRGNFPSLAVVQASAENTGLPAHSFGLITAAQAFHWFDEVLFREECKRLIRPNGRLAVVFNSRGGDEVIAARDEVCKRYCPLFAQRNGHAGRRSDEEGNRFLRGEYFARVEVFRANNPVTLNKEQFLGDTLSRSYALRESDERFAEFAAEINAVFERYQKNGAVSVNYTTTCYAGRF